MDGLLFSINSQFSNSEHQLGVVSIQFGCCLLQVSVRLHSLESSVLAQKIKTKPHFLIELQRFILREPPYTHFYMETFIISFNQNVSSCAGHTVRANEPNVRV